MPLKQLSTGYFCHFGAVSAAATSLSFGGRLRQTELPESSDDQVLSFLRSFNTTETMRDENQSHNRALCEQTASKVATLSSPRKFLLLGQDRQSSTIFLVS